jgi:ribonuclease J
MSALTRMAQRRHKGIQIKPGDTVILSSRFIPGNEKAITSVINRLYRLGADVVYEKVSDIHTSGHAKREELKCMLSLARPRYFVPIHGEYRHLVKHAQIALEMGMADDQVLIAQDGDTICFDDGRMERSSPVTTGKILVDGKGIGNIDDIILKERRKLSGHGMVVILLVADAETGEIIYGPEIISRGFVFEEQGRFILEDAECIVLEVLDELERPSPIDCTAVESEIARRLKRFFYKVIERSPLITPVIIPI